MQHGLQPHAAQAATPCIQAAASCIQVPPASDSEVTLAYDSSEVDESGALGCTEPVFLTAPAAPAAPPPLLAQQSSVQAGIRLFSQGEKAWGEGERARGEKARGGTAWDEKAWGDKAWGEKAWGAMSGRPSLAVSEALRPGDHRGLLLKMGGARGLRGAAWHPRFLVLENGALALQPHALESATLRV